VVSIQRSTSRSHLTEHNNTGFSTKLKATPEFLIQTIYKPVLCITPEDGHEPCPKHLEW